MKPILTALIAVSVTFLLPTAATAYSETPFVNAKKGDTKTARGWIVQRGEDATSFLVVVTCGCRSGHTAFFATAAANVVSNDQLGRPMTITAKVVERIERKSNYPSINLKILQVKRIAKKKDSVP